MTLNYTLYYIQSHQVIKSSCEFEQTNIKRLLILYFSDFSEFMENTQKDLCDKMYLKSIENFDYLETK